MKRIIDDCRHRLITAGIGASDAENLRRISMTLQRWFELECGDGNDSWSWAIVRGHKDKATKAFVYDDDGSPFMERHSHRRIGPDVFYSPLADREKGARKRLAAIMARYPGFTAYVQTDPRGAALYILRPGDLRDGDDASCVYNRGVVVHR